MSILGQGGNAAPVITEGITYAFRNAKQRAANGVTYAIANEDVGLYVSGTGTEASKSALKTYDGYVYAIPLFKVNRRNTGGYSVNNPNGAIVYKPVGIITDADGIAPQATKTVTLSSGYTMGGIKAGDRLVDSFGNLYFEVVEVLSSTSLSVKNLRSVAVTGSISPLCLSTSRPDNLYANIIDERDITDLRHKTYLVAPSYEQLLIDGTDQILRGASQVERKKAMRKTYVGVRKTPLDANHVFYASFDGAVTPEVGSPLTDTSTNKGFIPMPSGAGIFNFQGTGALATNWRMGLMTVDFWMLAIDGAGLNIRLIDALNNTLVFEKASTNNAMYITTTNGGTFNAQIRLTTESITGLHHVRFVMDGPRKNVRLYIDGKLRSTTDIISLMASAAIVTGNQISIIATNGTKISDVAISNVDRGASFATLPADFIAGYADITPALSDQRRINSDAQTSQKSYAAAKVKNQPQERFISVTKGTGANTAAWEAGDKIKVKGLAGEIISGVIDSDTALARITAVSADGLTISLDDVSKIAVSDTFLVVNLPSPSVPGSGRTIVSIDAMNKTATINIALSTAVVGQYLVETTASTSSPVVRAIISGTSTTVSGTWTALGTNEAEVTLGLLPGGLVAQDIIIEYSLNMPAGLGSLYQVYTKTLSGEANGKKLIPGAVAVTDDFAGKITGSTVVNPNKAYSAVGSALATPTAPGTEFSQADYDAIKSLDNSLKVVTISTNGQQAQMMFSIDLIREIEDKYGKIPGVFTVAEKVAWLKANISAGTCSFYGYGNGPLGNKTYFTTWYAGNGMPAWSQAPVSHAATIPSKLDMPIHPGHIDNAGFVHYLAYTDVSDGVTAAALYADQFTISISIPTKSGYDTLVPENARRDAGLAGVLYVLRQTREVESLFLGNDEDNGISVIGEYLPTQEMTSQTAVTLSGSTNVLLGSSGFVTTAGTNAPYDAVTPNAYANAASRLMGPGDDINYKIDPQSLISTVLFNASGSGTPCLRFWRPDTPLVTGVDNSQYTDGIPSWAAKATEFLTGFPSLIQYNGELLLKLSLRKRSQLSSVGMGSGSLYNFYRLPGRPLVKL